MLPQWRRCLQQRLKQRHCQPRAGAHSGGYAPATMRSWSRACRRACRRIVRARTARSAGCKVQISCTSQHRGPSSRVLPAGRSARHLMPCARGRRPRRGRRRSPGARPAAPPGVTDRHRMPVRWTLHLLVRRCASLACRPHLRRLPRRRSTRCSARRRHRLSQRRSAGAGGPRHRRSRCMLLLLGQLRRWCRIRLTRLSRPRLRRR